MTDCDLADPQVAAGTIDDLLHNESQRVLVSFSTGPQCLTGGTAWALAELSCIQAIPVSL